MKQKQTTAAALHSREMFLEEIQRKIKSMNTSNLKDILFIHADDRQVIDMVIAEKKLREIA